MSDPHSCSSCGSSTQHDSDCPYNLDPLPESEKAMIGFARIQRNPIMLMELLADNEGDELESYD